MTAHLQNVLSKLDSLLPQWFRRLIRNREWQKSSVLSSLLWLLNTAVIFKLVEMLGHGWQINLAASLAADAVLYTSNKLWIWRKRKAAVSTSAGWSLLWWVTFLGVNTGFAWLLMSLIDLETIWARGVLGFFGVVMNPIVFTFRDKVAFRRGSKDR